jgi:hypothetical protein
MYLLTPCGKKNSQYLLYWVTIKEIDIFNVIKTVSVVDTQLAWQRRGKIKICFHAFIHDVSSTSAGSSVGEGMLRSVWTELDLLNYSMEQSPS